MPASIAPTRSEAQVAELATLTAELVELAARRRPRGEPEPVDPAEVVEAALNRVRIRAPGLTFTAALQPATVLGRANELERLVVNVVDDVAKFSSPEAAVHTDLRADSDGYRLTISDDGPGIDEADRPHVFDRFYRAAPPEAHPAPVSAWPSSPKPCTSTTVP